MIGHPSRAGLPKLLKERGRGRGGRCNLVNRSRTEMCVQSTHKAPPTREAQMMPLLGALTLIFEHKGGVGGLKDGFHSPPFTGEFQSKCESVRTRVSSRGRSCD